MHQKIFSLTKSKFSEAYTPEYIQLWETKQYHIDPIESFSLQSNSDCPVSSLYGLAGLMLTGSFDYEQEKDMVLARLGSEYVRVSETKSIKSCDAINMIETTQFINPL